MKLISIDIEAPSGDSDVATMLEFAAVGFDTSGEFDPVVFHKRFVPPANFSCQLTALIMNAELLKNIDDFVNNRLFHTEAGLFGTLLEDLFDEFFQWGIENGFVYRINGKYQINVIGKNFERYDFNILQRSDVRWKELVCHRILDIAAYYVYPSDQGVPNSQTVKKRSGLFKDDKIHHNAATDALEVAEMAYNKLSAQTE